jgi:hypothetical protein
VFLKSNEKIILIVIVLSTIASALYQAALTPFETTFA